MAPDAASPPPHRGVDVRLRRRALERVVQPTLIRRQVAVDILDDLRGQIFQHLVFGASHHERHHLLVESSGGESALFGESAAFFGGDGSRGGDAVRRSKLAFGAEEARHEKVEEAPQLDDVVLDGGAGEQQPVLRADALHRLRDPRLGVANGVALVEDAVAPRFALQQLVGVGAEGVVRGDDDVVLPLGDERSDRRALVGRAVILQRAQHVLVHVLVDLVRPVSDERRWAHHERGKSRQPRRATLHHRRRQDARRLQRLPEAHVVAQRAVQLEPPEKRQPVDPLLLIRSQRPLARERKLEILNLGVIEERLEKRAVAFRPFALRCR